MIVVDTESCPVCTELMTKDDRVYVVREIQDSADSVLVIRRCTLAAHVHSRCVESYRSGAPIRVAGL